MKISKLLQNPEFNEKIESAVSGHIVAIYQKANMEPPIPRWQDNQFVYADSAPAKYAKHLREGIAIMAGVLDKFYENGEINEK